MPTQPWARDESLAGRTFFHAVASPAYLNESSYIQLYNPPNSGVSVELHAWWVAVGQQAAGEYGMFYYSTPFDTSYGNLRPTRIGQSEQSKSIVRVRGYGWPLVAAVMYFSHSPTTSEEPRLVPAPFPLILMPSVGIVWGAPYLGHEMKVGMWIREVPVV